MKKYLLFFLIASAGCHGPKTETQSSTDSVTINTVQADMPAPAELAFEEMKGFTLENKVTFKDSVNYFLISSQDDLASKFTAASDAMQPDYLINYVVAVACSPTQNLTTIVMDRAEVNGSTIEVYLTINRGEEQKFVSKPSNIFSIEKRDGIVSIVFFVNEVRNGELLL